MVTEKEFLQFKQRVNFFIEKHQANILRGFQKQFYLFKNNYEFIKRLTQEIDAKEAANFNVFRMLGLGHLEVKTHTPFLAELLDPRGSHGQGNLFLRIFLKRFVSIEPAEINDKNWKIIKETESIDLKIANFRLGKSVFIENKIYTGSHSGQLSRYYKKWKGSFPKGGRFIYLTIYGDPPNDSGFDDSVDSRFPKKEIQKDLLCISYKKDIIEWFKLVIPNIQAQQVKDIILQYVQLINEL